MVNGFHKMKCYNFQIITAITAVIMVFRDLTTDVPLGAAVVIVFSALTTDAPVEAVIIVLSDFTTDAPVEVQGGR